MIVMFYLSLRSHTQPRLCKLYQGRQVFQLWRIISDSETNAKKRGGLGIFLIGREENNRKMENPELLLTKVNKLTFQLCDLLFRLLALTCEQFEPN